MRSFEVGQPLVTEILRKLALLSAVPSVQIDLLKECNTRPHQKLRRASCWLFLNLIEAVHLN